MTNPLTMQHAADAVAAVLSVHKRVIDKHYDNNLLSYISSKYYSYSNNGNGIIMVMDT